MLSDVRAYGSSKKKHCKVIVLVGTFENTHFGQGTTQAAMKEGVQKMRDRFKPALKGGLLEIRVHHFTQKEIASMISKATHD
jgi:hypothetical protein